MEGLKVYYRGVEVPSDFVCFDIPPADFITWKAGVDAALDGPEEAPKLTRAFASVREWAEAHGVGHGDLDYMARAWSPGEPKPRVFHRAEDIPADVDKVRDAHGWIAARFGGGWTWIENETGRTWTREYGPDFEELALMDLPVTEVIE